MKNLIQKLTKFFYTSAGDECPQCHKGILRDTGNVRHGERVLKYTNGICGWEVLENS